MFFLFSKWFEENIHSEKALPYASRDEKKVSIYVLSKCPGEKQNLFVKHTEPTHPGWLIHRLICTLQSRIFKKENHIFCCCFFPDTTYSDFCSFTGFFFSFYFTTLLLKAFWFIANFSLFRLSCTIWYVCWLVIMELNLWACYSSNDILFLLVLFLPGLDMFYEFLSYSTGIHIWYNQNSISHLISLQRYKPKYFLFFCMMLELVGFLFNIWKHFLPHQKLQFARNPLGESTLVCLEGREESGPPVHWVQSPSVPLWRMGWGWWGETEGLILFPLLQSTYLPDFAFLL